MGLKQLRKRIYCMENEPCGAVHRPQEQCHWKSIKWEEPKSAV